MTDYLVAEFLNSANNVIFQPIQQTQRIKYTAYDVSQNFIIFGASSGGLYIFNRYPCAFIRLIPSTEGSVTYLSISSDEKIIAVATAKGTLCLFSNTDVVSKDMQVYCEHQGSTITAIKWNDDNSELYTGDNLGKVSVITKTMFQSPCAALMQLDSRIVQIDQSSHFLLVSTLTRCYLCDTETEHYRQIGKKLRDGDYGACFFGSKYTYTVSTEPRFKFGNFRILTEKESFVTYDGLDDLKLFCSRPGSRIWEVQLSGIVIRTHQFKQAFAKGPGNVLTISDSTDSRLTMKFSKKTTIKSHNFMKMNVFNDRFIITYQRNGIYILDPQNASVVFWTDIYDNILDMRVFRKYIYLWTSKNHLHVLLFSTLEDFIIKSLLNKKYQLCADLCISYQSHIKKMLHYSKKLYLLSSLKEKLVEANEEELSKKIEPVLTEIREYGNNRQGAQKLSSGIFVVDNDHFVNKTIVQNLPQNQELPQAQNCSKKYLDANSIKQNHKSVPKAKCVQHKSYPTLKPVAENQSCSNQKWGDEGSCQYVKMLPNQTGKYHSEGQNPKTFAEVTKSPTRKLLSQNTKTDSQNSKADRNKLGIATGQSTESNINQDLQFHNPNVCQMSKSRTVTVHTTKTTSNSVRQEHDGPNFRIPDQDCEPHDLDRSRTIRDQTAECTASKHINQGLESDGPNVSIVNKTGKNAIPEIVTQDPKLSALSPKTFTNILPEIDAPEHDSKPYTESFKTVGSRTPKHLVSKSRDPKSIGQNPKASVAQIKRYSASKLVDQDSKPVDLNLKSVEFTDQISRCVYQNLDTDSEQIVRNRARNNPASICTFTSNSEKCLNPKSADSNVIPDNENCLNSKCHTENCNCTSQRFKTSQERWKPIIEVDVDHEKGQSLAVVIENSRRKNFDINSQRMVLNQDRNDTSCHIETSIQNIPNPKLIHQNLEPASKPNTFDQTESKANIGSETGQKFKILCEEYELSRVNPLYKTHRYKHDLADCQSAEDVLTYFREFETYAKDFYREESDLILWALNICLNFFETHFSIVDICTNEAQIFLQKSFEMVNSSSEKVCGCGFPLPGANATTPKFSKIGQDLLNKLWSTSSSSALELCAKVPYMWKYIIRLRENDDVSSLLPVIIQLGDEETLKYFVHKLTYDLWNDFLRKFIMLKTGKCLNCEKEFDLTNSCGFSWDNISGEMVKSVGGENCVCLLLENAQDIPESALATNFYQSCIFSTIVEGYNPELRNNAVRFVKNITKKNSDHFGKLLEKGIWNSTNSEVQYTLNNSQNFCPYCNLPLQVPVLSKEKYINSQCGFVFHNICFKDHVLNCGKCKCRQ